MKSWLHQEKSGRQLTASCEVQEVPTHKHITTQSTYSDRLMFARILCQANSTALAVGRSEGSLERHAYTVGAKGPSS